MLKSPTATVIKPYEVLTQVEQAHVLNMLEDRPRDQVLVALALGAGLRASELTGVKVGDVISDDDGADWLRVMQGKGRKDRMIPLSPDVAQRQVQVRSQCKRFWGAPTSVIDKGDRGQGPGRVLDLGALS